MRVCACAVSRAFPQIRLPMISVCVAPYCSGGFGPSARSHFSAFVCGYTNITVCVSVW